MKIYLQGAGSKGQGMVAAVLLVVALLTSNVFAQSAPEKKASKDEVSLLKPIILTADEKKDALDAQLKINQSINDANQLLEKAKAEMTAAQEAIKRLQSEFNVYVMGVALKKRVDPDKYEISLAALDDKAEVVGFRPKPSPVPDKK